MPRSNLWLFFFIIMCFRVLYHYIYMCSTNVYQTPPHQQQLSLKGGQPQFLFLQLCPNVVGKPSCSLHRLRVPLKGKTQHRAARRRHVGTACMCTPAVHHIHAALGARQGGVKHLLVAERSSGRAILLLLGIVCCRYWQHLEVPRRIVAFLRGPDRAVKPLLMGAFQYHGGSHVPINVLQCNKYGAEGWTPCLFVFRQSIERNVRVQRLALGAGVRDESGQLDKDAIFSNHFLKQRWVELADDASNGL